MASSNTLKKILNRMNHIHRTVTFSPPDMTEAEVEEVGKAILSGWITTGPRTKQLEKEISEFVNTEKTVCLNSATASMEMVLHLLGIGPGDEVIVPAYTYTATASVTQHVGCKLVMVDSQKDSVEMDYDLLERAITEKTKVIVPVDLGGIVADYDRVFEIANRNRYFTLQMPCKQRSEELPCPQIVLIHLALAAREKWLARLRISALSVFMR